MFAQVHDLQAGAGDGADDLTEGPLPLHRPAGRERVVDVAATKVAAVFPDARPIFVPRPQDRGRVFLVDEQVPRRAEQARGAPGPRGQVRHPDQGAFTGVDEVRARVGQRRLGKQIVVLMNVLSRRRLPGGPVRPRRGIHDAMLALRSAPVKR